MNTSLTTTVKRYNSFGTGFVGAFLLAGFIGASLIAMPATAQSEPITVDFVTHLDMEMVEQDVFVEKTDGSGDVFRVTTANADRYMDAPVYGSAEEVHHDPMNAEAVGPYPKGSDLGMTLGDWLAATGSATVTCTGSQGTVRATFENLVPDGVYTMWYFFMATPPTADPARGVIEIPVGARDGSQNTFTADADGRANFEATFEPCLQMSGSQLMAGLAIAWHSDRKTYGLYPGKFGRNSHVQIFGTLPKAE